MYFFQTSLFYFIIYSFLGWIIESLFNLFTKKTFLKDNFLHAPLKPMYGFAATLLLLLKPIVPFWAFCLLAFFIPTAIEYITALFMDYFFNLKYWDYSTRPFNLNGYVCLTFSCSWVLLTLAMLYLVHPLILMLYSFITPIWYLLCPILLVYLLIDFSLALSRTTHNL